MKNLIIVIASILFIQNAAFPENSNTTNFFPLKLGNTWIYSFERAYPFPVSCKSRVIITGSLIINNKTYFNASVSTKYFSNGQYCGENMFTFINTTLRFDSVSGNIFIYSHGSGCRYSPDEILFDSLKANKNDSVKTLCGNTSYDYICSETGYMSVFGESRMYKEFSYLIPPEYHGERTYVNGIGLWRSGEGSHYSGTHQLVGALINGNAYGDTSFAEFISVSGTIKFNDNNELVTSGFVKAFKRSSIGNLTLTDSAEIKPDGTYLLTGILPHDTIDLMAFQNDEVNAFYFVPTFDESTIYWQQSQPLCPVNDTAGIDIGVYRISNAGNGTVKISGGVYGYTDRWNGIEGARLYARSVNSFRNYAISLQDGSYVIDSLPDGYYQVICNMTGYSTQTKNVFISNTDIINVNFYYNHFEGIKSPENVSENYYLHQNYPNPFNPVTVIKFDIPSSRSNQVKLLQVKLYVYNILGEQVAVLFNKQLPPGSYGVRWDASGFPSGVYFYTLEIGDFKDIRKMVLVK